MAGRRQELLARVDAILQALDERSYRDDKFAIQKAGLLTLFLALQRELEGGVEVCDFFFIQNAIADMSF